MFLRFIIFIFHSTASILNVHKYIKQRETKTNCCTERQSCCTIPVLNNVGADLDRLLSHKHTFMVTDLKRYLHIRLIHSFHLSLLVRKRGHFGFGGVTDRVSVFEEIGGGD